MKEIKWAVLGCGVIANEMAVALQKNGKNIYAVGNRTHEKAAAFAEKYGIGKVYDDFHENVVDVSEGPVSTGIISIFHCLKSPFTTFLLQFATRRLSLRSLYVSRPTRRRYPFSEYPGHG